MKTYTKTIWNICACMLIILLGGCADDDIIRNDCGSTLQETESHLISTFSLPEGKSGAFCMPCAPLSLLQQSGCFIRQVMAQLLR